MVKYRQPATPEDTFLDKECRRIYKHIEDELYLFIDRKEGWVRSVQDDFVRCIKDSVYLYVHNDGQVYTDFDFDIRVENVETFTMIVEVKHRNYVESRIITISTELPNFEYDPRKFVEEDNRREMNRSNLSSFYNTDTLSFICTQKVQRFILSPDVNNSVEHGYLTMQEYLERQIEVNGGIRSSSLTYSIGGHQITFALRLYDIDKMDNVSSKYTKKFFLKAVKKFHLVEEIYKRLLRINNAVLAFYIMEEHNGFRDDLITWKTSKFEEYIRFNVAPVYTHKAKYVVEHSMWITQILPYIRFNLIEALELMGSSYYDHEYTRPDVTYDNWITPISRMFDDVVHHYGIIRNHISYKETVPISYDMIQQFLNTEIDIPDVHNEIDKTLYTFYKKFYNHNEIESILVLDYTMGIYRSIGYMFNSSHMSDDDKGPLLANLYDMVEASEECIKKYDDIDQCMLNHIGSLTWSYSLAFISKYRNAATNAYLKDGFSLFGKRKSKNPDGLYNKPANYRLYIFSEFEEWITNKIILRRIE